MTATCEHPDCSVNAVYGTADGWRCVQHAPVTCPHIDRFGSSTWVSMRPDHTVDPQVCARCGARRSVGDQPPTPCERCVPRQLVDGGPIACMRCGRESPH